jgi:CHASE2 domain-containing sensor protein
VIGSALHEFRERFAGTRRVGEAGAAIAIAAGLLAYTIADIRYLSFDIPFRFRPEVDTSQVAIIYLDEESCTELHQPFGGVWHRALHIELLEQLRKQGAKVVAFDLLWDRPWASYPASDIEQSEAQLARVAQEHPDLSIPRIPRDEVDSRLAEAIKRHGRVVLAGKLAVSKPGEQIQSAVNPAMACEPLKDSGPTGFTEVPFPPAIRPAIREHFYHPAYPTLAEMAARLAQDNVERTPPNRKRWFNFYGPPGKIESRSYYQVLQRDGIKTNFFAGKIVFVGMDRITTPQGRNRDDFPTPYFFRDNMQGVEIEATACLNYLRGDWLFELSPRLHLALLLATGALFGFVFSMVRPWIAVVLGLCGFLGSSFAGVQVVWQTGTWFSWLVIAIVQIPAALTWALLVNTRQIYRENVALERKLATVTSTPPATTSPPEPASVGTDETIVVSSPDARLPYGSGWLAQPGDVIADHQLVRCVGEGAYGQVWLARNVIGTYTAIKLVYRSKFKDEVPFDREFQGLKRFMPLSRGHPGLVQILHVGKTVQYFYYVMEAGDDETTQQIINPETYTPRNLSGDLQKRASLPATECLKLAIDLSAALEYLHQRQLIHRDIKPSNIIFVNGQPKIADIGLVTAIATTRTDATYIGTPGYIPPEGPGTAAADVYSLGKVIYEASMGRHVSQCPALPTSLIERSDYRALLELNEIVAKAAAENVQFRYQSAAALHRDLVELQTRLVKVVKSS